MQQEAAKRITHSRFRTKHGLVTFYFETKYSGMYCRMVFPESDEFAAYSLEEARLRELHNYGTSLFERAYCAHSEYRFYFAKLQSIRTAVTNGYK